MLSLTLPPRVILGFLQVLGKLFVVEVVRIRTYEPIPAHFENLGVGLGEPDVAAVATLELRHEELWHHGSLQLRA